MSGTYLDAARSALGAALEEDDAVVILGEDVAAGGPFGLTKGLAGRVAPGRVRNTPISEGAVAGVGVGLALGGRRPFIDLMFNDFITAASDQLFNHAAKIHYMSGGRYSVPLTVWTVGGAGTRWGAQHSQRLDGWLAQVPGLKVLAPSTPSMAASSVRAALADPDPVVVFADRGLLFQRADLPGDDGSPWWPRVVRPGGELTVVASGLLLHRVLTVVESVGVDAEVIDLQRIAPLDVDLIAESVRKTRRLLLVHEESAQGGLTLSIAARVSQACHASMEAPVLRLTPPPTPIPAAASLEDAYLISDSQIEAAIRNLVTGRQ